MQIIAASTPDSDIIYSYQPEIGDIDSSLLHTDDGLLHPEDRGFIVDQTLADPSANHYGEYTLFWHIGKICYDEEGWLMIPGDESSTVDLKKTSETFTETTIASTTDTDGVVTTTVTTIETTRVTEGGTVVDTIAEYSITTVNSALKNDDNDALEIKLLAAQAALRDAQDALPDAVEALEDAEDNKLDQELKNLAGKLKDVIKKTDKIADLTAKQDAETDQHKIDDLQKKIDKEQGKLDKLLADIDKINLKIATYEQAVADAEAALAAVKADIVNTTVLVSQISAALDRLSGTGTGTTTPVALPPTTVGGAGTGSVGTGSTNTGRISWRKLVL